VIADVLTNVAWIGLAGTIGGAIIAGPIMWYLRRFDARNTEDHGVNKEILTEVAQEVRHVSKKIEQLDVRMYDHIQWHADQISKPNDHHPGLS
jgi:hypothetical protein